MKLWAGTSGYSYKEWKGNFYPSDLAAKDMLQHYSGLLPAVEINNTFYRMPKKSMVESWASQVPETFRFSIKATRRITHMKRLKDTEEETSYLLDTLSVLEDRLGVLLFQLPPYVHKNLERLEGFLKLIPEGTRAAFEFRHPSWMEEDVFSVLRDHGTALCTADTEDGVYSKIVATTDWGYLRLRRPRYPDEELHRWLEDMKAQGWADTFVFFKHEDEGAGPAMARRLLSLV